jgi:hypothetical protein
MVPGSRIVSKTDEHAVVVSIVSADHRAIGRGLLSDNEVSTGHSSHEAEEHGREKKMSFHHRFKIDNDL